MERPAAGGAGEPAGKGEQSAPQRPCASRPLAGEAEQLGPAEQVVGEAGDHCPGGVGVEAAGGEVRERLVDEVADHELNDGVLAMLFLDQLERLAPVSDEGEVLPGRKQLLLIIEGADPANDQPLVAEHGLGDLGRARLRVVGDRPPLLVGDRLDRRGTGLRTRIPIE